MRWNIARSVVIRMGRGVHVDTKLEQHNCGLTIDYLVTDLHENCCRILYICVSAVVIHYIKSKKMIHIYITEVSYVCILLNAQLMMNHTLLKIFSCITDYYNFLEKYL